jgi:hypothetical protein
MVCYYAKWIGSAVYQCSGIEFRWGKIKSFRAKILTEKLLAWMFIWDCSQHFSPYATIRYLLIWIYRFNIVSQAYNRLNIGLQAYYRFNIGLQAYYRFNIGLQA